MKVNALIGLTVMATSLTSYSTEIDSRLSRGHDDSSLISHIKSRLQGFKKPQDNTCNNKYLSASSKEVAKAIGKNIVAVPLALGAIITFEEHVGRLLINPANTQSYGELLKASGLGAGSVGLGVSQAKNISLASEYHHIAQIITAANNIADCPEAFNGSMHPQASFRDIESKVAYADRCRGLEDSYAVVETYALGEDIVRTAEVINALNLDGELCRDGLHISVDSFFEQINSQN